MELTRARRRRIGLIALAAIAAVPVSAIAAPQILAFPHRAQIGRYTVYSEVPIALPAMRDVLARADARLATSPIDRPRDAITVFLTDGGWRWHLLTLQSSGAFGVTRAINSAVLINRNSVAGDRVVNGAAVGGVRPLSQVIAHEETHNLLRHHFGLLVDWSAPLWKREGYCDYVSGGGSLSDADAADLERRHVAHPALPYYHGRKQVAVTLAANGGSVDALFAR